MLPLSFLRKTGAILVAAGCLPFSSVQADDRAATKPRQMQDAVTPVCRDPKQHEHIMALRAKGDPIDLIFIGASIFDFWPSRGPDSWEKLAPFHPADFGAAGDCTENALWRIENGELDGLHPKVVVVNLGNNNIGGHPDEQPAWAAAGVRKVVDTIHEKLPDAKILLLCVFPRDGKNSSNRKRNDAVNRIIAGFNHGDTPKYLDISKAFLDPWGELGKGIMGSDSLHPTAEGYRACYKALLPTLSEMMK